MSSPVNDSRAAPRRPDDFRTVQATPTHQEARADVTRLIPTSRQWLVNDFKHKGLSTTEDANFELASNAHFATETLQISIQCVSKSSLQDSQAKLPNSSANTLVDAVKGSCTKTAAAYNFGCSSSAQIGLDYRKDRD